MADQWRDIFGEIPKIDPVPEEKPNPIVEERFSAWVNKVQASSYSTGNDSPLRS